MDQSGTIGAKLRKQSGFSAGSRWTGVIPGGTLAECSRETDTHQIVSQAHRARRKVCLKKKNYKKKKSKVLKVCSKSRGDPLAVPNFPLDFNSLQLCMD